MPGSCPAGLRRVPAVQSWLPQRRGKGGSEIRELGRRQQAPPDVGCFGERRAAAGAFLRKVARVARGGLGANVTVMTGVRRAAGQG